MDLFEIYVKGFLEGCDGKLTKKEVELLPMGAKVMTFECGMRFLTDLSGWRSLLQDPQRKAQS